MHTWSLKATVDEGTGREASEANCHDAHASEATGWSLMTVGYKQRYDRGALASRSGGTDMTRAAVAVKRKSPAG